MRRLLALITLALLGAASPARVDMAARILPPPAAPGKAVLPFVKVSDAKTALVHVRIIDGTGAAPLDDRTLLIDGGEIAGIVGGNDPVPAGYRAIDASGDSVMPGIVGMHDHQYYIARPNLTSEGRSEPPVMVPQMTFTSPRMYLAAGVTTLRTTGSVEPYTDLNMKGLIDAGTLPGPHMDVTGPYLEGAGSPFMQMHALKDAADATRTVNFWADQGATSFKAYMDITRAELKAAIDAAHARGLKLTGHLCSVTYPEAVALGIDDLEHGFWVNTQLDPGKTPDTCPPTSGGPTLTAMTPGSAEGAVLIKLLVDRHVAVTSTLPVFEGASPGYRTLPQRQLDLLSVEARTDYFYVRSLTGQRPPAAAAAAAKQWTNELAMERAFVAAGGLLLAGPDPTGGGQVLPGFGDQRAIELLVEAGFTPVEAIRIGTLNGAIYMGVDARIGSIAAGKDADLVLVKGDPSKRIADIENVATVFKDGIGYDPAALLASVRGRYGEY
ncbi:amidohydrolase family protein [Sphingomonas sp.]|jgi:imidazolonepropionase-like amidohydrolase|uniref:amidohydrolase family protein n=1 Tax=Sphingomonas sp. TaxID=28214 RepID=UPI002E344847|nr:amidohydrolase family protein [Sphingomonas sp.]HEX4693394.1 amidohydrolase family protein [Sphingomonas sp.]